jgi:hypothetical protein
MQNTQTPGRTIFFPDQQHGSDGRVKRAAGNDSAAAPASKIAAIVVLILASSPATVLAGSSPSEPDEARLRAHIVKLASPEFGGRRGAGGIKTAQYLVENFQRMGLRPAFNASYSQTIPGQPGQASIGRNVAAVLPGSDPALQDEWIVVSAHFDHLGRQNGELFPGADDNASGVAMMLEVARSFAESPQKPRRSLMFVGFDLEEVGLFGSRYFVAHSPVPLSRIGLFITADMIGRSFAGVCEGYVFVMGTEHAPGLRPWIENASARGPVKPGLIGSDLLLLDRSDYGPFRAKKVPYLFFSTGENPCYHTPEDTAETLDYEKAEAVSRIIMRVCNAAADADHLPTWTGSSEPTIAEAQALRETLRTLHDRRVTLDIGPAIAFMMRNTLHTLDGIVARGAFTVDERTAVVRVARIILASLF